MKTFLFAVLLFLQSTLCSKVYDCFTFFNELELLKIRLEELYDVVDYFIIVEGKISFTGKEKPLYFAQHADEYAKYKNKIIHIVIDSFSGLTGDADKDHWIREEASRNAILRGLINCEKDDVIFISDLDEIPNQAAVRKVKEYLSSLPSYQKKKHTKDEKYVCSLDMRLFMYQLNRENPQGWNGGAKACTYWMVEKYSPWGIKLFHHQHQGMKTIKNAGWHFNTMGGKELALYKWLHTGPLFNHEAHLIEMGQNPELLQQSYQGQVDYHTKPVAVDQTFPKYLIDNLSYYRSIGWIADY